MFSIYMLSIRRRMAIDFLLRFIIILVPVWYECSTVRFFGKFLMGFFGFSHVLHLSVNIYNLGEL